MRVDGRSLRRKIRLDWIKDRIVKYNLEAINYDEFISKIVIEFSIERKKAVDDVKTFMDVFRLHVKGGLICDSSITQNSLN